MKEGYMVAFVKRFNKFLSNTQMLLLCYIKYWKKSNAIFYTYIICHIKYIYDLGKDHRIETIMFYIWNWIALVLIAGFRAGLAGLNLGYPENLAKLGSLIFSYGGLSCVRLVLQNHELGLPGLAEF